MSNTLVDQNELLNLAIVGSRTMGIQYYDLFKVIVNKFINTNFPHKIITIVTGDEPRGIDFLASKYAKENNMKCIVFQADWKQYEKAAGPIRNAQIVKNSDVMLALPSFSGRGTQNSIKQMMEAKKPVWRLDID